MPMAQVQRRVASVCRHNRRGLIDRQGTSCRGRIGNLFGKEGQGFMMELKVGHDTFDKK